MYILYIYIYCGLSKALAFTRPPAHNALAIASLVYKSPIAHP